MTFGSLFAGIGGFDLGFERAGLQCKWQVETDPYCQKVLAKHWPNVRRHDDVRTFPPRSTEFRYSWRALPMGPFAPDVCRDTTRDEWGVDVICGGFPCQDISNAGRRAGIEGERSGLWFEFARIVRILRPSYVVVENVAALLGRGIGRVLSDLAECGYDAEWDCLPAAAFGAIHIRNRIFLLAYRADANCEQYEGDSPTQQINRPSAEKLSTDPEGERGKLWAPESERSRRFAGSSSANADDAISRRHRPSQETIFAGRGSIELSDWWSTEPNVGRVANGVPRRVDRLRGLGNAVVPQIAEWIGCRLMEATGTH